MRYNITKPHKVDNPIPHERLSRREREIFDLILQGKTTREIADQLGIAFKTVETHRSTIYDKMQLNSVSKLFNYAYWAGLLPEILGGQPSSVGKQLNWTEDTPEDVQC